MEQTLAPDIADIPTGSTAERRQGALTVEHLLYFVALLVAFGLRFINLGESPLSPHEAAQAWPAWLAATGTQVANAPAPTSALLYGLQSWLFFLTGGSDALARLLPALAGTALVLLPWWWRAWLGRGAALVVAWLLALDPWLTALSRAGDGAILSIALGLLALTALGQWLLPPHVGVRTERDAPPHEGTRTGQDAPQYGAPQIGAQTSSSAPSVAWERTLAVSLGLLLVSGPLAWSWLPVLGLFAWYCLRPARGRADWTTGESTSEAQASPAHPLTRSPTHLHRSTWLWFAAALLLGASGFLAWPGAFGALGAGLSAWLAQWSSTSDSDLGFGWPFLRLAVDQPLLLVFGPLGLILLAIGQEETPLGRTATSQGQSGDHPLTRSPAHPRRLALFLTLWAAWGIILLLLPGRSPYELPMLGLPLAIAAGTAIAYLIALPLEDVGSLELVVLLAVAAILLIAGSIWLALAVESVTYDTRLAITAAALAVLTLAIWLVFGFWAGWRSAGKVAGMFWAAVLLLATVRSGWMLTQTGGRMAPDGLFAVTTLPEARLLANDVQRISSIRFGDPHEAPVQVATGGAAPNALLGWLLRDMTDLTWVMAPDPNAAPPAADGSPRIPLIVAPAGMEGDRGLGGMIGTDYSLTMRWEPSLLPALPPTDATGGEGLPAEELARLRSEQAWSQATRPQLEWLLYRTIKNEPPVDSVTLWAMPAE
jgi:hypothetical protein